MGKSALVNTPDFSSVDTDSSGPTADQAPALTAAQTPERSRSVEQVSSAPAKMCTMSESEIRARLEAFAKELAQAQRARSRH